MLFTAVPPPIRQKSFLKDLAHNGLSRKTPPSSQHHLFLSGEHLGEHPQPVCHLIFENTYTLFEKKKIVDLGQASSQPNSNTIINLKYLPLSTVFFMFKGYIEIGTDSTWVSRSL